jgi:drug/metabolite transporter (DMT)-like permease
MLNILPIAAVLSTVFFWGSSFPVMSFLLETSSPVVLGAGRFSLAAFFSLLWCIYSYKKKISINHAFRFSIAGFIGIFLYNIFLNYGQQNVSAGASSFIVNCNPLFTALIGFFILKQKVKIIHWLGITFCLIGVTIISIDQEGGLELGSGATLILFAAILTATYFHILKPLVSIYGALTSTAYTILFGTIPMLIWFPETFDFVIKSSDEVRLAFLWLALFPTMIGYLTWTYTVGHYGANKASLFLYLIPPISIVLDFIWYDNTPSLYTIIGGLIIILSVSLTLYLQSNKVIKQL